MYPALGGSLSFCFTEIIDQRVGFPAPSSS
jgi:hypothetical protein